MAKESIDVVIEGGKATAAPPLGPALGPLKINIAQVVSDINEKTSALSGMQVPVKVTVDTDTKQVSISVGTPPASALIKQAAGIKKAASNPATDKVADLKIEQVMKVAKTKEDGLLGKTLKEKSKEIIGTCQSMGVYIEGKIAQEFLEDVNKGVYDKKFASGKTELTAEELKEIEEEQKRLAEELEAKRSEYEAKAKEIVSAMQGKDIKDIKEAMQEAELPGQIIEESLPKEEEKKPEEAEGEETPKEEETE
ncbi:50S ribosomal protein L11 [Candidatus Woesearchaeota archaeon]|nr:50S ribosomal protein L11 [Candidatus Woesearchaeota archaeon]